MRLTRRRFLKLTGAGAVAAALPIDGAPVLGQNGPVRLGILAAKAAGREKEMLFIGIDADDPDRATAHTQKGAALSASAAGERA